MNILNILTGENDSWDNFYIFITAGVAAFIIVSIIALTAVIVHCKRRGNVFNFLKSSSYKTVDI